MSSALDKSLDDLIRNNNNKSGVFNNNNNNNSSFRGRGRGSYGPGPTRRFANRFSIRTTTYSMPQTVQMAEPLRRRQMSRGGESSGETGTKIYISNLDYGVSNQDIKVLFSEVGDLKRYSVHYDRSGRSKGTAEVVFLHQTDALAAIKRYNNVQLGGKPMKIELVGMNLVAPAVVPPTTPTTNSILGNPKGAFRSGQERIGSRGWVRGGGGRGFGMGHARGRGRGEKISAEDLDADLVKYHFEAMQIN